MAMIMRIQLFGPNNHLISAQQYNELFTMHGTIMLLLFATPLFVGFANEIMPLQIGAPDVAFPRLNLLSYYMFLFGGLILLVSFLTPGGAASFGWYAYAPLNNSPYSPGSAAICGSWAWRLPGSVPSLALSTSSPSILCMRAPGMAMFRMPIFTWNTLLTSMLVLMAFPVLTAALLVLEADRKLGARVFSASSGGAILWQHLFWFFGHPEVYIVALPVLRHRHRDPAGVQPQAALRLQRADRCHHCHCRPVDDGMGAPHVHHGCRAAAVLLIHDLPDRRANRGQVLQLGRDHLARADTFEPAMLFILGFLVVFLFGGLTGVILASPPLDFAVSDSYFVVAHFHYVLFGTVVFCMFGGFYFWWPKWTGKMLDHTLGTWHFWTVFIGFNMTFLVQHWIGVEGMPRRVVHYLGLPGSVTTLNQISTIGSLILGASTFIFLYNIYKTHKYGERVTADDPWGFANSLEWATSCPPPRHNFTSIPPHPLRAPGVRPALSTYQDRPGPRERARQLEVGGGVRFGGPRWRRLMSRSPAAPVAGAKTSADEPGQPIAMTARVRRPASRLGLISEYRRAA